MSANAIRAGRAFVELFADDAKLTQGLRAANAKLKAFGSSVQAIGDRMATLGAAISAPLMAAASHFSTAGDAMQKMAGRTGASVEALSQLAFAAGQSGTSIESVEGGLRRLTATIEDARQGSKSAAAALSRLGLSAADLAGQSPDRQLELIADRLQSVPDAGRRAAAAMDLFGKSGTELLPLLSGGSAGLRGLREQAERLGLTMSTESANAAADLNDALGELWAQVKALTFEMGAAAGTAATEWIRTTQASLAGAIAWTRENQALVASVAKVGAVLTATGAAVSAVGRVASLAGGGLGAIATGLTAIYRAGGAAAAFLSTNLIPALGRLAAGASASLQALTAWRVAGLGLLGVAVAGAFAVISHAADVELRATQRSIDTFVNQTTATLTRWRGDVDKLLQPGGATGTAVVELRDRLQREMDGLKMLVKEQRRALEHDRENLRPDESALGRLVKGVPGEQERAAGIGEMDRMIAALEEEIGRLNQALPQTRRAEREQQAADKAGQALLEQAQRLRDAGATVFARARSGSDLSGAGQAAEQLKREATELSHALQQQARAVQDAGLAAALQGEAAAMTKGAAFFDDLAQVLATKADPHDLGAAAEAFSWARLELVKAAEAAGDLDLARSIAESAARSAETAGERYAGEFFRQYAGNLQQVAAVLASTAHFQPAIPSGVDKAAAGLRASTRHDGTMSGLSDRMFASQSGERRDLATIAQNTGQALTLLQRIARGAVNGGLYVE